MMPAFLDQPDKCLLCLAWWMAFGACGGQFGVWGFGSGLLVAGALLQHYSNLGQRKCLGLGLGDITPEMENQMEKNMEHGMVMEMGSIGMVGIIPPVSKES